MLRNLADKRGDVILVMFPNSDLVSAKLRPALVVQADGLQTGLGQVIVAMITGNRHSERNKPRHRLTPDAADG